MKKILTAAIAAAVLTIGAGALAPSPAEARDSGWGCGGACRTVGR